MADFLNKRADSNMLWIVVSLILIGIVLLLILVFTSDAFAKARSDTSFCSPSLSAKSQCVTQDICKKASGTEFASGKTICKKQAIEDKSKKELLCCSLPENSCITDKDCGSGKSCKDYECVDEYEFAYEQEKNKQVQTQKPLDFTNYDNTRDSEYAEYIRNFYSQNTVDLGTFDFVLKGTSNSDIYYEVAYYKAKTLLGTDDAKACTVFKDSMNAYIPPNDFEVSKEYASDKLWFYAYCSSSALNSCDVSEYKTKFDIDDNWCMSTEVNS